VAYTRTKRTLVPELTIEGYTGLQSANAYCHVCRQFYEQVIQIVCGGMHTLALTTDGHVYSWGVNDEGALGREAHRDDAGSENHPAKVNFPSGERIVQLSAGDSHSVALSYTGDIFAWGSFRDSGGVMGFSQEVKIERKPVRVHTNEKVIMISSGADHIAAITGRGKVITWGCGDQGQLGRTGERFIERFGGKVAQFVDPRPIYGNLDGKKMSAKGTAVFVACGSYCTFVVTENGNVYAWGLNNYGQLGLPLTETNVVRTPTKVPDLCGRGIFALAGGQHHSLALASSGIVYSFGRSTYGRLGRAAEAAQADEAFPTPEMVEGLPDDSEVIAICAGQSCSGAVLGNGNAWLWGSNTSYQIGKGDDDTDAIAPTKLRETKTTGRMTIQHVSFGGQHSALVAVPRDGV